MSDIGTMNLQTDLEPKVLTCNDYRQFLFLKETQDSKKDNATV